MRKIISVLLFLSSLWSIAQQKDFVLGKILTLQSTQLNEERTLNIYLPNNYDEDQTYPVIYLLDGSDNEDFIHIVGLVQYGNFEWINMVSKSIVVGISNIDRKRDFTYPTMVEQDKKDFPTTGASAKFIAFIENELQPFIERNYKTSEVKTIIGQSLGGLLATEILYKKPTLFTNYIIISPSIWWDKQSILQMNPEFLKTAFNKKIKVFIGVGKEGKVMEHDAKKLFKIVSKQNKNIESHFHHFKENSHGDVLHLAVYKAFEKLKI